MRAAVCAAAVSASYEFERDRYCMTLMLGPGYEDEHRSVEPVGRTLRCSTGPTHRAFALHTVPLPTSTGIGRSHSVVVDGCSAGQVLSLSGVLAGWVGAEGGCGTAGGERDVVYALLSRSLEGFRQPFTCTNLTIALTSSGMQLNCTLPAVYYNVAVTSRLPSHLSPSHSATPRQPAP